MAHQGTYGVDVEEGWDPYEELGVSRTSSTEEIKAAFRQLALRSHPDKRNVEEDSPDPAHIRCNGQDPFIRIRLAYEILNDVDRRATLDAGGGVGSLVVSANGEVDLDDMTWDESRGTYSYQCRCSGTFVITTEQLEKGFNTLCCCNCSLCMTVLYEEEGEEGPNE